MCGIAGFAALDPRRPLDPGPLAGMLRCVAHRGPDDEGSFTAPGVVLGHRRLSVIDLEGGHQPLRGARESTVAVDTLRDGDGVRVRFTIQEGRPVLVSAVEVTGAEGILPLMDTLVEMEGGWKFMNFVDGS